MSIKSEIIRKNGLGMLEDDVKNFENKFNIKIPIEYKNLLMEYGYLNIKPTYINFEYEDFKDEISVVDILGNREKGSFDFYNETFKMELPENFYVIAASEDGKFLINGITEEVYFWDDFRIFDISSEEQNIYMISNDFKQFINLINDSFVE